MGCRGSKGNKVGYEVHSDGQTQGGQGGSHRLEHSATFADIRRREDAIASRYEESLSILVTDMSGFTRLTKKRGIIHFASLILKMRSICRPIYEAYGALSIMTEADNFLVLFPTPEAALAAAVEAKREINAYNKTITDEDFKPIIGGYGIGSGRDTIQAKNHMLFGEARDIAFRLGEDVAENGEICIDHLVKESLAGNRKFAAMEFTPRMDDEEEDPEQHRLHYVVEGDIPESERLAEKAIARATAARENDDSEWSVFMTRMIQRLESSADRVALDLAIKNTFVTPHCVLVVGLDFSQSTEKHGVMHSLGKMVKISKLIQPILRQYNGEAIEDTIFRFTNTTDCLMAALKIKSSFLHINKTQPEREHIAMKGFGIHRGEMLFCPGSDVHWGDPLNTSSKLGEDLATDGTLYITAEVYKTIRNHRAFQHLDFEKKELEVSHVTIACYAVTPQQGQQEWETGVVPWERSSMGDDESDDAMSSGIRFFAGEKAVLVSDMSGFSRITRKHGIIHYASLICTMRDLLTPMFEALGAICIETEADNFFVVFADPLKAVMAGVLVYKILETHNGRHPDADPDFRIKVGGVGIAFGSHILQDEVTGKLYGAPVDRAFRLGEDIADGSQILIDSSLHEVVLADPRIHGCDFEELAFTSEDGEAPPPGLTRYYSVTGVMDSAPAAYPFSKSRFVLPKKPAKKASDAEFFRAMIVRRLELPKERDAVDSELRDRFFQQATVVMVGADYAAVTAALGVRGCVSLKQKVYAINKAVVTAHNGTMVEEGLWVFRTPLDAVAAAIEARRKVLEFNVAHPDEQLPIKGLGVHSGHLLVVKDTNVHWGDPVNTASKLGEDFASNGELFISQLVYDAVHEAVGFAELTYDQKETVISGVNLLCYAVEEGKAGTGSKRGKGKTAATLAAGPSASGTRAGRA